MARLAATGRWQCKPGCHSVPAICWRAAKRSDDKSLEAVGSAPHWRPRSAAANARLSGTRPEGAKAHRHTSPRIRSSPWLGALSFCRSAPPVPSRQTPKYKRRLLGRPTCRDLTLLSPRDYCFARFQVCQICPDPSFVPNSLGTAPPAGSKQILYWSGPSNS